MIGGMPPAPDRLTPCFPSKNCPRDDCYGRRYDPAFRFCRTLRRIEQRSLFLLIWRSLVKTLIFFLKESAHGSPHLAASGFDSSPGNRVDRHFRDSIHRRWIVSVAHPSDDVGHSGTQCTLRITQNSNRRATTSSNAVARGCRRTGPKGQGGKRGILRVPRGAAQ